MRDLWNRLERWLEQNVPDILPTLNPGASMQEIEAIQISMTYMTIEVYKPQVFECGLSNW